ncbi:MAG TPA: pitrilysin family protein [Longimicrobiales bacterium]|nr:pitrilysin family protein [Longimicrobiales bacterium]
MIATTQDRAYRLLRRARALAFVALAPLAASSAGLALTFAAVLAAPVVAHAQVTAQDRAHLVTEFDVNGLQVLVKQREGSQTAVAALFFRGGAANLTEETAGIEALMLEVAVEASDNFPREQLRRELASMGTELSSASGLDYSVLLMSSTRLHFDRSWEIFTDVAMHPTFAPDDFERVKNRLVLGLLSAQDSPDAYLQQLQAEMAYVGHPYRNDPAGTVESLSALTLDDVRAYHDEAMQTSRLLLVLVGDLDPSEVQAMVAETLGRLPRGNYVTPEVPQLQFDRPAVQVTPRNLPTNYVQGIFPAPPLSSPDYPAMRVATTILQSRVFYEVREERNLSYAPNAFLWNQAANAGGIYVTAVDANQAVAVMLNEISRLKNTLVLPNLLTSTAQHFLTTYYLDQQTNTAQAAELGRYELIGGGWRNADAFLERLRTVTPEDVRRVANTYMRNLQFVVLGNPARVSEEVFLRQP